MSERLPADEAMDWAGSFDSLEDPSFSINDQELANEGRCAVLVEFESIKNLVEWFRDQQRVHGVGDTALYRPDAIDAARLPFDRKLVLKRAGDRPASFRLMMSIEEEV